VSQEEIQVECSEHHNQLPVLVDSVQVIDDPQRVIKRVRSVVWLEFFNDVPRASADSLYLSLESAIRLCSGPLFESGEFDLVGCISLTGRG